MNDQPSRHRKGPTVLVLLDSVANEAVLRDVLAAEYSFVVPEDGAGLDDPFDLCVLDDRSLARRADALERRKRRARPTFLPYVLVTDRPPGEEVPRRVWRRVDDVLHKPVSPATVHNRLASHVRTRALSIQFARSEARFAALVRTATDAIFILDETATIVFANPAVEDVLGYDPRDLTGRPVTALIPERFREAATAGIARTLAGGRIGSVGEVDSLALHRDGTEIPVRLSYNQFRDDDTRFVAGIVHDVTERTRREQRLRVLNRVLRHDIRNDVNVIQGWAERLRETGENVPEYAGYIEEKVDEMVHLSDQARQIEQLSHTGDDALGPVDLVARVRTQLTRTRRAQPDAEIDVDLPERADVVSFDLVDSAIDNVLENAIVHADTDRPAVDVGLSAGEAWVELRIADRGPGIPQQELTALERGDEAPLTHSSGLGLWLTEWIVSESGGTLRFETNEPSGTVVSMTFRAASVEAETEE